MTDPDDKLSRRYRELAREEPPAPLDAAILAAARQAAQPRMRSRWMRPVAVAAVLVLGLGLALRMQVERPGLETAAPEPAESEYPAALPPADQAPAAAPKAPVRKERVMKERVAPAAARPPATPATPMQSMTVPEPRPRQKLGVAAESVAPERAKRAEPAAAADAPAPTRDAREAELERIARLRAEGRHADADKALEAFRRAHPDYRIAEAMWQRVRPR